MNSAKKLTIIIVLGAVVMTIADGCKSYDNFTTFFNTYYNAKRLMSESEEEFAYTELKRRDKPRVIVPADSGSMFGVTQQTGLMPPYLREYIIDQQKLQPVQVKLDSIFDKGSKIISRHPKSNYIEGSLYLMAKAFFYKSEWVPTEVKCSELIDKYPDGEFFVDVHLLAAKAYLIERKFQLGKLWLSRTIDVAWYNKRYDILSEAFKISAEQALFENDVQGALRPYRQAIAQTDDDEQRARWQLEVAALLYRLSRFEEAEREFNTVLDYSPDFLGEFEAKLYRASSLIYLKRYDEAQPILDDLAENTNYADWQGNVHAEKMRLMRLANRDTELSQLEKEAEKFAGNTAITTHFFERGMDAYNRGDYIRAKGYFLRSKQPRSVVSDAANNYFVLLSEMENKAKQLAQIRSGIAGDGPQVDTMRGNMAKTMFELARVYQQLGKTDSANILFRQAADSCPMNISEKSKYLYVASLILDSLKTDDAGVSADSLMEIIALNYPKTEYGSVAAKRLGIVRAIEIDSATMLFDSGSRFRKIDEFHLAVRQFLQLVDRYPDNALAPKALYTVGWLYEKKIQNNDSALIYYDRVLKEYPSSEYARDLQMSVRFAMSLKETQGRRMDSSVNTNLRTMQPQDSSVTVNVPQQLQQRDSTSVQKNGDSSAPIQDPPKQNTFTIPKGLEALKPDVKLNLPFDVKIPDLKLNTNDSTEVKKP